MTVTLKRFKSLCFISEPLKLQKSRLILLKMIKIWYYFLMRMIMIKSKSIIFDKISYDINIVVSGNLEPLWLCTLLFLIIITLKSFINIFCLIIFQNFFSNQFFL